jgi:catechol 2,3-dioxygenase-like lactoylglutathione lyase family enzyme
MAVKLLVQGVEIGIVTTKPDPMLAFYGEFLGLEAQGELQFEGGRMRRFGAGQSVVKVVTFDEAPAAANPASPAQAASGFRYLTLVVEDLRAVLAAAESAGHRVTAPITEFQPGIGYFFLEDPDGNVVELAGSI